MADNNDRKEKVARIAKTSFSIGKEITGGAFSTIAPATTNTVKSARSVMMDFNRLARRLGARGAATESEAEATQGARKSGVLFNKAMSDVASGSFAVTKANNDMYEDAEAIDDSLKYENLTTDEAAELSPEEITLMANRGVSKSIFRASSAQLEGMSEIAKSVMRNQIKTSQAAAKSVSASIVYGTNVLSSQIMVTNSKLDTINQNISKLIQYNTENTTKFYTESLKMLQGFGKMMEAYADSNRGRGAAGLGNFDTSNGFDFKEYVKWVKGNYKKSMAKNMKDMFGMSMPSLKDGPQGLFGMLGMGVGEILKGTRLGAITKLDKHLTTYMDEILKQAKDKLDNHPLFGMLGLGDILGNRRRELSTINLGQYQKGAMPWNGKAQKALTEVIPELLTSIDAGINGTSKRYYDFERGKFKSQENIEKEYKDALENMLGITASTYLDRVQTTISDRGLSDTQIKQIQQIMSSDLQDRILKNKDAIRSRQDISDQLYGAGIDQTTANSLIHQMEEVVRTTTKMVADYNQQITTTDSVMRNLMNNTGRTAKESGARSYFDTVRDGARKNLFEGHFAADTEQVIEMVTEKIRERHPSYAMDRNTRSKIVTLMQSGESDIEILRQVKNAYELKHLSEFGTDVLKDFGLGILDKWRPREGTSRVEESRAKRIKSRRDSTGDDYESTKFDGKIGQTLDYIDTRIGQQVMGYTYGSRATRATGDTTLQNRRASSQRSQMDGVRAGAQYAHNPGPSSSGQGAKLDTNVGRAVNDITDAAANPFDLDATDDQLAKQDRTQLRAMSAVQDLAQQAADGNVSTNGFLASVQMAMGSMMTAFTSFTTRLVGKNGFMNKLTESPMFKESLGKLKEYLFNEETGIFKDQVKALKGKGRDLWGQTKDELSKGYDWFYKMYYTGKYGEDYESDERWKNSKIAQKMNFRKRYLDSLNRSAEATETTLTDTEVKGALPAPKTATLALPPGQLALAAKSGEPAGTNREETVTIYHKLGGRKAIGMTYSEWAKSGFPGIESLPMQAATEAAEKITKSTHDLNTVLTGDDKTDFKKSMNDGLKSVTNTVKQHGFLPKAGAAAIGGGLLGMFLPMGPIGGAIAGAGLNILSRTEAFQSILFGKVGEDGERSGGLLTKELRDKMKKAAPDLVKSGVQGGAIAGGLGLLGMSFLPGGIVGGAILGIGTSLIKNNEDYMNLLFGKRELDKDGNPTGRRDGKFLSKAFNSMNKAVSSASPYLKRGAKGLGIGALTGATLGAAGLLPGAAMAGPIGLGVAGLGLGIASATRNFNEWLFGTEEIDPETGKPTGRHTTGILGKVRNLLMVNFVQPMADSFKNNLYELVNWTKLHLFEPFRMAFGPILDSITNIKDNITDIVKDTFERLGAGIKNAVEGTVKTLFSPIGKLFRGFGKALMGGLTFGAKTLMSPATIALKGLELATMGKRRKEYVEFYKQYLPTVNSSLRAKWDAEKADGRKRGFFGRMSDRIDAYTGRGEIADAAREGYNAQLEADGQNHLNWRSVPSERRQLREDMRNWRKGQKQWKGIDRYARQVANKDLHGSEVELSPAQFKKYQAEFARLGISKDLLQSSDDIMQLLYHREDFKRRASGKTGNPGELNALAKFRETPEQAEAREKTSKYQSNVEVALNTIIEKFKDLGDDRADAIYNARDKQQQEDATTRAMNERRHIMRQTRKTDPEAYYIWKDIDFNDPGFSVVDMTKLTYGELTAFVDEYRLNPGDVDPTTALLLWCRRRNIIRKKRESLKDKRHQVEAERAKMSSTNTAGTTDNGSDLQSSVNEIKDQLATQTALQSGGAISKDDVNENAKKSSWLSSIGKKFSSSGFFGNLFNRKARADAKAKKQAAELAESAEAQSLGDEGTDDTSGSSNVTVNVEGKETEKKKSLLSTIFGKVTGAFGSVFGLLGKSKIVSGALKIGKTALLGTGIAGLAIGIMDILKPGSSEVLQKKVTDFTDAISNGNAMEDIVKPFIHNLLDKIGAGIGKLGDVVVKYGPDLITNHIGPAVVKGLNFLADNATLIANLASDVITTVVPPIANAFAKVVPSIAGAFAKAFWNSTVGNLIPSMKLGKDPVNGSTEIDLNSFADPTDVQAFVDELNSNGSATYAGSDGQIHTMYKSGSGNASIDPDTGAIKVTGVDEFGNKVSTNSFTKSVGKTAFRSVVDIAKGGTSATIGRAGLKTLGAAAGVIPGAALGSTIGVLGGPVGAVTGAVTGGIKGAKRGASVAGNAANGIASTASRAGTSGFTNALTQHVVMGNGLANVPIIGKLFGNTKNQQALLANVTDQLVNTATLSDDVLSTRLASAAAKASAGGATLAQDLSAREMITEAVASQVDAAMAATNTKLSKEAFDTAVSNATARLIKENGDDAVEAATRLAKGTATRTASAAVDAGVKDIKKKGLLGLFDKVKSWIGKIAENEAVQKIVKKFTGDGTIINKFIKGFNGVIEKVAAKVFADERIWMKYASAATEMLAKIGINATPIGVIFATYDIVNGAFNATALFNVPGQGDVDWLMRLISALLEFVFGVFVPLDLILEIGGAVFGKDFKCMLATTLYKAMAPDDGGWGLIGDEQLEDSQIAMQIATDKYNASHGTNLTAAELNDKTNLSPLGWILNGGKWVVNGVTNGLTGGHGTNFETVGSVKAGMESVSDSEIQAYKARQGLGLGYGIGPTMSVLSSKGGGRTAESYYRQSNPQWANQKLGRFPNGEVATMASAGCGPTAMAMAVKEMTGLEVSPGDMGKYAVNNGYITAGGANAGLFTEGAKSFGLSSIQVNRNNLKSALASNIPTVISGKGGSGSPFTPAGHVVIARGIDRHGRTTVEDPMTGTAKKYNVNQLSSGYNTGWTYGRMGTTRRVGLNRKAVGYSGEWNPTYVSELQAETNNPGTLNLRSSLDSNEWAMIASKYQSYKYQYGTKLSTSDARFRKLCADHLVKPKAAIDYLSKNYEPGMRLDASAYTDPFTTKLTNTPKTPGLLTTNVRNALMSGANPVMEMAMGTFMENSASRSKKTDILSEERAEHLAVMDVRNTQEASSTAARISTDSYDSPTFYLGDMSWTKDRVFGYIKSAPNFFQKMIRIGHLLTAFVQHITNGTTVWEEFGKIVTQNGSANAESEMAALSTGGGDEEQLIWTYLINKGYTPEAAAGIMGCWEAESGNSAARLEGDYIGSFLKWVGKSTKAEAVAHVLSSHTNRDRYTTDFLFKAYDKSNVSYDAGGYQRADGHYYPGMGLAQWTGGRALNLGNFATKRGLPWEGLDTQLQFFDEEMDSSYRATKNALTNIHNVQEAVETFYSGYESGGLKLASDNPRRGYAKAIYEKYKNLPVESATLATQNDADAEQYNLPTSTQLSNKPMTNRVIGQLTYGINPVTTYLTGGPTTTSTPYAAGLQAKMGDGLGYGPGDSTDETSFNDVYQGMNSASDIIMRKISEITGIDMSDSSTMSGDSGVTGLAVDPNAAPTQKALVDKLASIQGTLKYSLDGDKQNPDKGWGSCASTVSWAYRKVFGDKDYFQSKPMSASSRDSSKDSRFETVYMKTSKDQRLPLDILQPGDVLYQHWRGKDGYTGVYTPDHMSHTEMWVGDGKAFSHGSRKVLGPVLKTYSDTGDSDYNRLRDTMVVRRYKGFVGYGAGPNDRRKRVDSILRAAQKRDATRESNLMRKITTSSVDLRGKMMGFGPGATTEIIPMVGVENRLDKIFDLITQWYLTEKDSRSTTQNTTLIDASKKIIAESKKEEKPQESPIKSKIDTLANKHRLFAAV